MKRDFHVIFCLLYQQFTTQHSHHTLYQQHRDDPCPPLTNTTRTHTQGTNESAHRRLFTLAEQWAVKQDEKLRMCYLAAEDLFPNHIRTYSQADYVFVAI